MAAVEAHVISGPDGRRLLRQQQKQQQQPEEEEVRSMRSVEEEPRRSRALREGGGAGCAGGKHRGAESNRWAGGWKETASHPVDDTKQLFLLSSAVWSLGTVTQTRFQMKLL